MFCSSVEAMYSTPMNSFAIWSVEACLPPSFIEASIELIRMLSAVEYMACARADNAKTMKKRDMRCRIMLFWQYMFC
jgi:hypothetical protein